MTKNLVASLTVLLLTFGSFGQISVTNTQTPSQLVQNVLLGFGVTATNITINGSAPAANAINGAVTYFDATGTTFPIPSGVLLTTGNGIAAVGPNTSGSFTNNVPPTANVSADPHLNAIANAGVTNGVVLEFDFIPSGDTVAFNYIFGSDEYPEFSPSSYNDAFGFFLWGPGISGPYALGGYPAGGANLAIIPGTSTPVTINNLGPGAGQYPQYYQNNLGGAAYGNAIQYDGTTTILSSNATVQCGETYHIKLCISNVGDQAYDSGVFLQANSFTSEAIQVAVATVSGDTSIYEGCIGADLMFIRPESQIADTMIVNYTIGGTAIQGVDYNNLPNPVTFLPGEDTVTLTVTAIADGFPDNYEYIIITATTITQCGDTIISIGTLYVLDSIPITIDELDTTVFCYNDSIPVNAVASGVFGPFTYSWTGGQIGDTAYFPSVPGPTPGSIDYYVTATNSCGYSATDTVTISLINPILFINETDTTIYCPNDSVLVYAFAGGGISPYSYVWSNGAPDADSAYVDGTNLAAQDYYITATDQCGYSVSDTITVILIPAVLFIDETDTTVYCPNDSVLVNAFAGGGFAPYSYVWSNGSPDADSAYVDGSVTGPQDYYVTATDQCGYTAIDTITVVLNQILNIDSLIALPSHSCAPYTGEVHAYVSGITDVLNPPYFHWSDSIVSVINYEEFDTVWTNIGPGWYYFTVTDDVCSANDSIYVEPTDPPTASIGASAISGCSPLQVTFTNNSQNANYYEWDFGNGNVVTVNNMGSQSFSFTQSGTVILTAYEDPNCFNQTAISIYISICGCMDPNAINYNPNAEVADESCVYPVPSVIAPNVFTPNSDFENNYFFLKTTNTVMLELTILNRWGNEMFSAKTDLLSNILGEELIGWDGLTKRGAAAEEGVYFYKYTATGIDGTTIEGHGFLHLVRN